MERTASAFLALTVACLIFTQAAIAAGSNVDQSNCHHDYDGAKAKAAAITDPTKKAQAYAHLKTAYADFMAAKYTECIAEAKAVDALTQ